MVVVIRVEGAGAVEVSEGDLGEMLLLQNSGCCMLITATEVTEVQLRSYLIQRQLSVCLSVHTHTQPV